MFLSGVQHWISLHSKPFAEMVIGKIRPNVIFSDAPETLVNHSLPTGSISLPVFYTVVWIGCIRPPCNRGAAVFSHIGSNNSSCFEPGHILLGFHLKYFHFFFVNITRSYVI